MEMDKNALIEEIKEYRKTIDLTLKEIKSVGGSQIQTRALLTRIELLSSQWFENYETILCEAFKIEDEVIGKYRAHFGKLLELCGGRPSKNTTRDIFSTISADFHGDIIVPMQKLQSAKLKFPEFDKLLGNVENTEKEYLIEAIDCARYGKLRAAIILGWCAAISRLHHYIERIGFSTFNTASVQMKTITSGRYKRFTKNFDIYNFSELQMNVFDNDLLWILEFINAIDGNQHEKLEICFTIRNTCAHPGEATVTNENVLSFFSDLNTLIFSNPKFRI